MEYRLLHARADFSIMMEYTPESGHCESSVKSVLGLTYEKENNTKM